MPQLPLSPRKDNLLGIAVLLAFLLPHSNTLFLLVNPLMCLLLVHSYSKGRRWSPYVFIVIVPVVISLALNVFNATQKAFMSVSSILLYFFCFPFVSRGRVRNAYLYICLGYIVVSQLVYLLNIPFLTNFFDTAYPINENDFNYYQHMQSSIRYEAIFNYRLGGIYHNANNCAEYVNMLLAFFLVVNQRLKTKGALIFTILAYVSVLLTGSRTGFVVASMILYFGLLRQKSYQKSVRFLFLAMVVIGLGYIIGRGVSLRGVDVEGGFHNSANTKWNTFVYYITNENSVISLLFGHLDSTLFVGNATTLQGYFDCEYGDLVYRFGIIGFGSIILFWLKTARRIDKSSRFFFVILLWCISSSIVAAYRALFVFMLLLSVIYSNFKNGEKAFHSPIR